MAIDKQTRAEILRRFFAEKWKMGMIARHLGVHHNTVDRIVTEGGVPPQFTGKPFAYRPGTSDVKAMPVRVLLSSQGKSQPPFLGLGAQVPGDRQSVVEPDWAGVGPAPSGKFEPVSVQTLRRARRGQDER